MADVIAFNVARAARSICEWQRLDNGKRLNLATVYQALLEDCQQTGDPPPSEAECEVLVCGGELQEHIDMLNRYPRLSGYLIFEA